MTDFDKLKDDIIHACSLNQQEATGFYAVYCPICNKTNRKTGGFKFEADTIGYNCFRASCDASCVFELGSPVSRKFRRLMDEIGVSIPVNLLLVKSSFQKDLEASLEDELYTKHFYKQMKVPDGWVPLSEDGNKRWIDYYTNRHCPIDDIFIIKKGMNKGLTAVAMYYFDKLIGFQVVNPNGNVKYWTDSVNTQLLAFGSRMPTNTVIVVEGLLDAICFPNTAGTLSKKISPEQAYMLRGKNVIMLPDRGGNSFIDQFHDYGWKLCVPPWDYKDLNEAVCELGVITVAKMIMDNSFENKLEAKVRYDLWRSNDKD